MWFEHGDGNPFSDFLIQLVKDLGPGNNAINHEDICNYDDLPSTSLFKAFRERLTGGSSRADFALTRRYVRLDQIPKELRPPREGEDEEDEHVVSERVKWLEAKVPDEDWSEYKGWLDSLDISLDTDKSSKEGDENV